MGSGRGDRNQLDAGALDDPAALASMGSGRGDRNQLMLRTPYMQEVDPLQWGPVVVTGIRSLTLLPMYLPFGGLQ